MKVSNIQPATMMPENKTENRRTPKPPKGGEGFQDLLDREIQKLKEGER